MCENCQRKDKLLQEALNWLKRHAGWDYGFSVDELEQLQDRMATEIRLPSLPPKM